MKPLAEVVKAFGCQGIIVVLPGEAGLDVAFRGEGLHGFDYLWTSSVSLRNVYTCLGVEEVVLTKRFFVSICPWLGRLKSFFATRTPSEMKVLVKSSIVKRGTHREIDTRGCVFDLLWGSA
jgi:hypothetical protein